MNVDGEEVMDFTDRTPALDEDEATEDDEDSTQANKSIDTTMLVEGCCAMR